MGLVDCLPRPITALGMAAFIESKKTYGNNYFSFEVNGTQIWYEYTGLRDFSFFYNAIRGEETREQVPVDLFDLSNADAALDLGAHFGLYSVLLGALNPKIPVYAFEPMPSNVEVLKRNIDRNHLDVEVHQAAVNGTGGQVQMESGGQVHGLRFYSDTVEGRILDEPRSMGAEGTIMVQGIKLSKFLSDRGIKRPFLKIDIEGAEYTVVKDLLDNGDIDSVSGFLELHPGMCTGGDAHEILFWFEANDIAFELVKDYNPSRPGYYFTTDPEQVAEHDVPEWMDYLQDSV